ncbi:hypothetical protein EK21DRAFT_91508 [Setomelanomma holmii]|uniref:Uncharacterized protein n=1 Tax=Setomelanomma holmii TaxID=210430 RepID=A0A9P4LI17_9PLEO|nr:hypothetical protein EK21DRAFT_91508 [Setomelanomma holmii]
MSSNQINGILKAGTDQRATAAAFLPSGGVAVGVVNEQSVASVEDNFLPNWAGTSATVIIDQSGEKTKVGTEAKETQEPICAACLKLGYVLPCCLNLTSPCPTCSRLIHEDEQHVKEINACRARTAELEAETPEEKHRRLCAEMNARIEQLRTEVEKVQKDDQALQKNVEEQKKRLASLTGELAAKKPKEEQEGRQEFSYKQAKMKKGKKK